MLKLCLQVLLVWICPCYSLSCARPHFDPAKIHPANPFCRQYNRVCLDQETYVLYGRAGLAPYNAFKRTSFVNGSRMKIDYYGVPDFWRAQRSYPEIIFRPRTAGEETPDLQRPTFSSCTLPVIMYSNYLAMYGEQFTRPFAFFSTLETKGGSDGNITIVLANMGMQLYGFLHTFLSHFSRYPIATFSTLSSRLPRNTPSNYTYEGAHVRCFERIFVCMLSNTVWPHNLSSPYWNSGQVLLRHYADKIPQAPAEYADSRALRVLFLDRLPTELDMRSILNIEELLAWCNSYRPPKNGSIQYSKAVCIKHVLGANISEDLSYLRETDILVGLHGSGLVNSFFMRKYSSLVEIRPWRFRRWPNIYLKKYTKERESDSIFWWGLNMDLEQNSRPGDLEKLKRGSRNTYARDRHVMVNATALGHIFNQIVEVGRNVTLYRQKRDSYQYYFNELLTRLNHTV